jgi:hypothetical protein
VKRVVIACAAALVTTAAPFTPSAHAASYRGGCSVGSLSDGTPGAQLGGQNVHYGVMVLSMVAQDDAGLPDLTAPISASCSMYVNGWYAGTIVHGSGVGVAVSAAQFTYYAEAADIVIICEHVAVSRDFIERCFEATRTPVVPQPVVDLLYTIGGILADPISKVLDPVYCPAAAASGKDVTILTRGVVTIAGDGDTYILGGLLRDCPPRHT